MPTGMVFNIQRAATEDGPGIRTTVFFKGCGLSCDWCHNPEGIAPGPHLQWLETRCIGCHACLAACARKALAAGPTGIAIERNRCDACGDCAAACPTGAMEVVGRAWPVAELLTEVMRDAAYYAVSGGGVTASGGEPALQVEFVAEVFRQCRARGIATALDTGGQVPPENYQRILPHTDLILFDIKLMDDRRHHRHTGHGNRLILENLERMAAAKRQGWPGDIWIRTPIIPGATDDAANIDAIGSFLASRLKKAVARWELCAFNNLCRDKYRRLGLSWKYGAATRISKGHMAALCDTARSAAMTPDIVACSGALSRGS